MFVCFNKISDLLRNHLKSKSKKKSSGKEQRNVNHSEKNNAAAMKHQSSGEEQCSCNETSTIRKKMQEKRNINIQEKNDAAAIIRRGTMQQQ